MRQTFISTLLAVFGLTLVASADNWPQWRGPNRDGISQETGLQQEWPAEGPKLVWQQAQLGDGYSTPAVVGNRIFLINNTGLENEFVQALGVKNGQRLWMRRIGKVGNPNQQPPYPGARSTPTVDGKMLYALGSDGDLVCMEVAKGRIRWQKNLRTDFGGKPGTWAYAESPLVDGNVLVVTPGGADSTIVALNKQNGELIWKSPIPGVDPTKPGGDPAGYSSAIIVEAAGYKQYVQFLGRGLVGVDAKTGNLLWRYDHTSQGSAANIATPVADSESIYTGTHYTGGGLVRLSAVAGGVKADEVYYEPGSKLPTAIGGAILLGENMFGTSRERTMCVNFKTGEPKWSKERALSPASMRFADGRLYLHGENGEVGLLEATPEAYRELGRFTPPNIPQNRIGKAWSYPAIADGRLYIHDWGTLWCYDVKGSGARAAARPRTPARN